MLEIKNVSFGKPPVLKGVSVEIGGGITAVIGANGAGKTTLLRCICGELKTKGEVVLDSLQVLKLSPGKKAKYISYLPQHLPSPEITVRETVSFGKFKDCAVLGEAEWQQVDEMLEKVGISELENRTVSLLSGGERQKVFLATVLLQDAAVLLLDEPTASIDIAYKSRVFELLREEAEKGKTVITVMHDLADAVNTADNILLLENGVIRYFGTVAETLENRIIEKVFSVTRIDAMTNGHPLVLFR